MGGGSTCLFVGSGVLKVRGAVLEVLWTVGKVGAQGCCCEAWDASWNVRMPTTCFKVVCKILEVGCNFFSVVFPSLRLIANCVQLATNLFKYMLIF